MKILFAGHLYPEGYTSTGLGRYKAMQGLGHELRGVDYSAAHRRWGDYLNAITFRLGTGPSIWEINHQIRTEAESFRPDLVWIDKGNYIFPETLLRVREATGARLVHYTPDPAFVGHGTRHFERGVPLYDLVVTTKAYELEEYRRRKPRRLLCQLPSYDRDVHFPVTLSELERREFETDLAFVGTYGRGRERFLRPIVDAGLELAIWGSYWRRCEDEVLRACARLNSLEGPRYRAALAGTKIGLGVLSPLWPDLSTTRSLEIPACGAFLLAERTSEHEQLFVEGREAEFFSTAEELIEKARFYLSHGCEREQIARSGRERCEKSGYSSYDRVQEILREMEAA